jgi:hypothetical protein
VSDDRASRAIVVSTSIARSRADVWAYVRIIERHVEWMHDAVAIRFLTDRTEGLGVRFECDTRVGPLSTTDVMEITAWEPERTIGVRHIGVVEGTGEFTLRALSAEQTEFRWSEDLRFPWFMGGPVGAYLARPLLRWIWRRNLVALTARLEGPQRYD